jgi:hypothetical protein
MQIGLKYCARRRSNSPAAVEQPEDQSRYDAYTGPDQHAFHWISDHKSKGKTGENAYSEETSPGERLSVGHRARTGTRAAGAPALSRKVESPDKFLEVGIAA